MKKFLFLITLVSLVSCGEIPEKAQYPVIQEGNLGLKEIMNCRNGGTEDYTYMVYGFGGHKEVKNGTRPSANTISVTCEGSGSLDKCKSICETVTKGK